MSFGPCPTVRVANPADPGGSMTINESDFDPAVHVRFQEAPARVAASAEETVIEPAAPAFAITADELLTPPPPPERRGPGRPRKNP